MTLTVTDDDGATHTDTTTCMISELDNRPPTKPIISGTINGSTNIQYSYSIVSTDPDNDMIQYTVNWGDTATQVSGFLPSEKKYTASHIWATPGQYNMTVTVTDNQTESSSYMTINIYTAGEQKPSTPGFELVIGIYAIVVAIFIWKKKQIL